MCFYWTLKLTRVFLLSLYYKRKLCCCLVTSSCPTLLWPLGLYVAHQTLSMGFPRQEYWSGQPFPSPGYLLTHAPNLCLLHYREILCCWATREIQKQISLPFSHSITLTLCDPMDCSTPRLPCPSPCPRVCSNSWPLSWRYHPTILSSALLLPSVFPSIRVFSNESALRIKWRKYWNFNLSIRPSNEHSGLISFRIDWLDLLAVQWILKSLLQHHSSKASFLFAHFLCNFVCGNSRNFCCYWFWQAL